MENVNQKQKNPSTYRKQHSFEEFKSKHGDIVAQQTQRAIALLSLGSVNGSFAVKGTPAQPILDTVLVDLKSEAGATGLRFRVTEFIGEEMRTVEDKDLPRYLYHRYRYDLFPLKRVIDEYPPYLQIEPSSICNFKCVFCYQTDTSFNSRSSGKLGTINFDTFKGICDEIEGKVEFISLASRGEPLVSKQIPQICKYTEGKFLGLKINTNASLLTEALAHDILSGGIKTVVFSADAAEEPLYSKLRVNGSLEKTVRNIEMFENIRAKHYPGSKTITRVSGVKVNELQDMGKMISFWGERVDQVAFVKYNPWENIYEAAPNDVVAPCSDLWRRMFIWFDGEANPCDTDYKSDLTVGNIKDMTVAQLWASPRYRLLRDNHANANRGGVEPCRRCYVV
jgi:radical SAM protein with 4Fe4S-binding SPASM domain